MFSTRTQWTAEENALTQLSRLLAMDNTPVLDLTVSNPTRCGFRYLNPGLLQTFQTAENLKYEPNPRGLGKAREIVCKYYARRGVAVTPEQIFLTANTSEAYSFIFKLLFEKDDFLLAPQPSYPLLDYLAGLHDIRMKRYPLDPARNWEMNLSGYYERQLEDPKAILVVNPNNPTGNFLTQPQLAELNIFCKNRPTAILSDEVFFDYPLIPSPARVSAASNHHNTLTFTLSGISKILGLPQMKLSWIVVSGPAEMKSEALKRLEIIADTYLSVSTPVQNALEGWFEKENEIQSEIRERITRNYSTLQNKFSRGGAVRFIPVQAGWHAPIQLPSSHSDEEWACLLLKKHQVLTHPGYLFDFPEGSFLVLSLLAEEKIFAEGLEKIESAVKI